MQSQPQTASSISGTSSDMGMLKLISKSGGNISNFFKTSAKEHEFLDAYRKLKALLA